MNDRRRGLGKATKKVSAESLQLRDRLLGMDGSDLMSEMSMTGAYSLKLDGVESETEMDIIAGLRARARSRYE